MNRALRETEPLLRKKYGGEMAEKVTAAAAERLKELCRENAGDCRAVKSHTESDIFPCIALYQTLQTQGVDRAEALQFLDESWSLRAEPKAKSMRALLKIPGMYKKMPAIFKWVAMHQFGEKAGFAASFYPTEKTRVKFDMTQCLYCKVCKRYDCPELVPCFCHVDDVTDGNMHPKLRWNRTKIMGDGADVCDFDLFVEEPKTK